MWAVLHQQCTGVEKHDLSCLDVTDTLSLQIILSSLAPKLLSYAFFAKSKVLK